MSEPLTPRVGVRGATIILRSGDYFDFLDPDPGTIHPGDIAWALANTCRFGGHSLQFYSVAQHCVLASQYVAPEHAFAALMHDAAEAYTGDVVKPLKQLLPDFKAVEDRVEAAIALRFDLTLPWPRDVHDVDLRLLRTEQRDLTAGRGEDWNGLNEIEPLPTIVPMPAPEAAAAWMHRFVELISLEPLA